MCINTKTIKTSIINTNGNVTYTEWNVPALSGTSDTLHTCRIGRLHICRIGLNSVRFNVYLHVPF